MYNLKTGSRTNIFDLSNNNITGSVRYLSFLNEGKTLAFQTHYGKIYFLEMDNANTAIKFEPKTDYQQPICIYKRR